MVSDDESAEGSGSTSGERRRSTRRSLASHLGQASSSSDDDSDEEEQRVDFNSILHERSYVFSLRSYPNRRLDPHLQRAATAVAGAPGDRCHAICTCVQFNGFGVNNAICKCGEDETDFEWTWDRASKSTAAVLSNDDREVKFHTEYSCGTAAVRGNQPMTVSQYYWEVKMTSPVYGTDMMVGVGTSEMDLDKFRHIFGSLLGYDNESWGFSYYGNVHHKGRARGYSSKFEQGSIIGVHLDMWRGTVAFFNNRQPLGIAYKGLQGKVLYPMVASTAARSGMRVIKSRSFRSSLQFLCCAKIRELIPNERCVLDALSLPPGLQTFLRNNLDWLLCARVSPCDAHGAASSATATNLDSSEGSSFDGKRKHEPAEDDSDAPAEAADDEEAERSPKRLRVT